MMPIPERSNQNIPFRAITLLFMLEEEPEKIDYTQTETFDL